MRYVIVTGMSGAGRTSALKMLEDFGFYSLDNLPISLISEFVTFTRESDFGWENVAIGVDARSNDFSGIKKVMEELDDREVAFEVLFLDSSDECLMRRYKESRRMHPLAPGGRVEDGIRLAYYANDLRK